MKRFLILLSLILFWGFSGSNTAKAFVSTYSGLNESNAYPGSVISNFGGDTVEETDDANEGTTNDLIVGRYGDEGLYIGFHEAFDGIAIDMDTSATGGSYILEYYSGTNNQWETLQSSVTGDLKNDSSSGVMAFNWDSRPSDWIKAQIYMEITDSGMSGFSDPFYFVHLRIVDKYDSYAKASQVGILTYNIRLDLNDELGNSITGQSDKVSFSSTTADSTIYEKDELSSGYYGYALYTPSSTSYTMTIDAEGYVQESKSVTATYAKTEVTESVQYSQVLKGYDPSTGGEIDLDSAKAGTLGETCLINGGRAYCSLTISEDDGTATVYANGYAPITGSLYNRIANTDSQASNSFTMAYAYVVNVEDEDGDPVTNADVEMGDSYEIDCVDVGNGQYGCVVPTSETGGQVRVTASGYNTLSSTFNSVRNDNSDAQMTQTFVLTDENDTNDGADLEVSDMEWQDDGDFLFTVENEGDEDVDSDENVWIYVYVDGDLEWSEDYENSSSSDNFLDENHSSSFNLGDDFLDEDEDEYEVEVCVDATDEVNEDNEDNCLERTLERGESDGNDEVDLEVSDLYVDEDGDLKFVLENSGDEDVESGENVYIYVYMDGDLEWSKSVSQSSSSTNFLDAGESTLYDLDDELIEDADDNYEVEVCVDATDNIDEEEEDNNCVEEDEDELEEGESEGCDILSDIDDHWAEEYICNLYDREIVEGRTSTRYYPDSDITRAEFLKIVILNAGYEPYATSVYYTDVSSRDWFYEYVTYATSKGWVEGYSDNSFKPNNSITRAEAVVILMRVAEQEEWDYDSSDIDFWDVEVNDWFAYAVVLADELNIVDGFADGSFRPEDDITRGEAAKIVDLAYEEFYN